MFKKSSLEDYIIPVKGIRQKTLVYGEKTLMTEFRLKGGSVLPGHSHSHEQTGYLVSGKIRLLIGSEIYDCAPGDSWCIPGGMEHGADIIDDSLAIEIFSPVREEYLPRAQDPEEA